MTFEEHIIDAERILRIDATSTMAATQRTLDLQAAQVHATLALALAIREQYVDPEPPFSIPT